VPNELLSRLVGERMYSVEFVLNDYVQLRFDGTASGSGPVVLNSYVWPVIDAAGSGIRIELDTGARRRIDTEPSVSSRRCTRPVRCVQAPYPARDRPRSRPFGVQ
jgi:hypothetical protein